MWSQNTRPVALYTASCDRVKMVDMHPKEPIVIGALYNGTVNMWNYETQTLMKTFETNAGCPLRCVKFIVRLNAFICGADDFQIRVYNYNTMERLKIFQAHDDYIRAIAVHDQFPIVLTSSDDTLIKRWDWNQGWSLQMTYQGHDHYCMDVKFNPRDSSTFASASLDGTIRIWNIQTPTANFQLEGHQDGVTCVEYYPRGDRPYLLSGSDDQTVRLWDYQTRACLQVFEFHTENITSVLFHSDQPLIFTASEDDFLKVISSDTFRLLHNLDHSAMERAWSLATRRFSNYLAMGCDRGVIVYQVGDDKPVFAMDSNGRVLIAKGNEMTRMDIKNIPSTTPDGEVINVACKDLGGVESIPRAIINAPGGQYRTILGANDYSILSMLTLRPKAYGSCIGFAWGPGKGNYAVLEHGTLLHVFSDFKERTALALNDVAEGIFAGPLFALQTSNDVIFYDWETLNAVRRIANRVQGIEWNGNGDLVALSTETSIYILRYHQQEVSEYMAQYGQVGSDGLEFAFELLDEVNERARAMTWVSDCLLFVDQGNRLNYYIAGEIHNLAVLSSTQFLLGYLAKENRVFFIDKERKITSYSFQGDVVAYMTAIVAEDFDTASSLLPRIDLSLRHRLAEFLETRGLLELALQVSVEDDHRFALAKQLHKLDVAESITQRDPSPERWKEIAAMALEHGYVHKAIEFFEQCHDYDGLLLIYSSLNDTAVMELLGERALEAGQAQIAFTCFHCTQHYKECVQILSRTGKVAEAASYARTYCPEEVEQMVQQWKMTLNALPRYRDAIASPAEHPELFTDMLQRVERQRHAEHDTKLTKEHHMGDSHTQITDKEVVLHKDEKEEERAVNGEPARHVDNVHAPPSPPSTTTIASQQTLETNTHNNNNNGNVPTNVTSDKNNVNDDDDINNNQNVNEDNANVSADNVNVNTLGDVDEEEQDMLIDMNGAKEAGDEEAWGKDNEEEWEVASKK